MQGSHTHTPKTNHVPGGYTVAAILSLFMVPLCLVPYYYYYYYYYYYSETTTLHGV